MDYENVLRQAPTIQLLYLFSTFSALSTKLNSKITYTSNYNMSQLILYKKDTSNAYVVTASKAYFFTTVLNHAELRDDGPIFRVMKEQIGKKTQIIKNVLCKL